MPMTPPRSMRPRPMMVPPMYGQAAQPYRPAGQAANAGNPMRPQPGGFVRGLLGQSGGMHPMGGGGDITGGAMGYGGGGMKTPMQPPGYGGKGSISGAPMNWSHPMGGMQMGNGNHLQQAMGRLGMPGAGAGASGGMPSGGGQMRMEGLGSDPEGGAAAGQSSVAAPPPAAAPAMRTAGVHSSPSVPDASGAYSYAAGQPANQPPLGSPGGPVDDYGYPTGGGKHGKKHGGHHYLNKLNNNAAPWLANSNMFPTATNSIMDILGQNGHMSPEKLIQEQAGIEQGRGQAHQAINARLAAAGVDPSSPMFQAMQAQSDQGANRLQAEARRGEDIASEQRRREDLNLVMPYLQALLGWTTKSGGNVQAAPVGQQAQGTDYAGLLAGIAGQGLQGYMSSRK